MLLTLKDKLIVDMRRLIRRYYGILEYNFEY
jgi:hypothetical protein